MQEGQQRQADRSDRGERHQQRPPAIAQGHGEPQRLDPHREEGEVVTAEGERRRQRPERQVDTAAAFQGTDEEEERKRAKENQQRVGACLLRVPDQHRVDCQQRRESEADRAAGELTPDQEADRDRRHADQRRERAQPDFAQAELPRPPPGEHVVEGRVRLACLHLVQHVAKAAAEDPHRRDHLVVVIALQPEGGEAERGGRCDDAREADEDRGAAARQGAVRAPAHPDLRRRRRDSRGF